MTYYHRICSDFKSSYDDAEGGLSVKFQELTAQYCQHPNRDGHYPSREFENRILKELEARELAARHRTQRHYWVFKRQI
jgi:hypothetical protein